MILTLRNKPALMMSASTSRSRPRRLSQETLTRAAVACERCRGRKTKCLGVAPYPCRACVNTGAECNYPDQPKKVLVSEKEWNEVKARLEAAESVQSFSPPHSLIVDDPEVEEDPWHWENKQILILTRTGEHQYVGPSASAYLAAQLSPTARGSVDFDVSPLRHANLYLRRDLDTRLPPLPPFDTAKRWYAAQFAYIGSIFSFIQPKYFEDRLSQVYERPPDTRNREDCLLFCQVLLILAFGQMYSLNEWSGNEGPPGFSYFQAALKLLPDIHEEGSVLFVEVLGLTAYYMQILNRRDAAFLYIGLAVRMAVSLGMHQEVANSEMDAIELEHRRRVWWSAYSMDRILCVKSGNPISIHDADIDAAWPSPLPDLDLDPAQPRILAHYTQLSRVLGKIGEDIYRKRHRSGKTLLASIQEIMTDLDAWLKGLPSELRLDFNAIQHNISRETVSTFLHYYQCVNMTGRPLLLNVCQRRLESLAAGTATPSWQEGLSSSIIHVVSNSIAAARTATSVMEAAAKQNLLATYGFMDGEHAFSAALVLVMANAAFPTNNRDMAAMNQALSVLQGMAQKGNEYIKARHNLLLKLQKTLSKQARGGWKDLENGELDLADQIFADHGSSPGQNTPRPTFEDFQDLSFNFDMEDESGFWDGSEEAQISMQNAWLDSGPVDQQTASDVAPEKDS